MAPVVTIDIFWQEAKRAPTGVEAMMAFKPYVGLTPTSTAEAMASGICAIAPVNPAVISGGLGNPISRSAGGTANRDPGCLPVAVVATVHPTSRYQMLDFAIVADSLQP
jgi:hypothetical protein